MTNLYNASHKQYDHTSPVEPQVEHSGSDYPHAEFKPASWLPVVHFEKKFEAWRVIMPGQVVAVDREGRIVPAGLKTKFEAAAGTTVLTYTADDYNSGTVDLRTGVAYATNGTTNINQTTLTNALRARGLITGTETARDFVSWPIGYAPYSYYQWVGGDGWNPAFYKHHNFNLQHQVAVGTDKILILPHVPSAEATETMGDGTIDNSAITFGTTQFHSATGLNATTRYSNLVAVGDNVIGYVFAKYPVAKISPQTPITDSAGNLASMTEVGSIAEVAALGSGYFHIDYEAGVMFLYSSGGTAVPAGWVDGTTTINYYEYEDAGTSAARIAQVTGDVKVGDFLTFDDNSSYKALVVDIGTAFGGAGGDAYAADPDYDNAGVTDADKSAQVEAAITQALHGAVGQVVAVVEFPRSGLEKVMSQYSVFSVFERTAGTATLGRREALLWAGASNKMVVVNFFTR